MLRYSSGFSLIELMIVISIVGILAIMSVPSYQHYTQQARFTEVIAATEPFKTAVSIALQTGAVLSDLTNGTHGIPASPKSTIHLSSITVENGVITALATHLLENTTYLLKPSNDGSEWTIGGSCLKNGLCHA